MRLFDVIAASRRRGGGGGGPTISDFSPDLWLDAADNSTFYNATTGGSLVTSGTFARWEDKSGFGHHATQATAANQFDRQLATKNGLPTVVSTGSPKSMTSPFSLAGLDECTVFLVIYADTSLLNYESAFRMQRTGGYFIYPFGAGASLVNSVDGGTNGVASGFVAGEWNVGAGRRRRNLATGLQAWRNNSLAGQRNTSNNPISSGASDLVLGAFEGTSNFFVGSYAEVVAFKRALSDADRESVNDILNSKWGVY